MKKILIIDENKLTLDIYKLIIEDQMVGTEVEYLSHPDEGIERVTKNGFDLLIVDFNLKHKNINGMDIARLAYPLGKPIILATGHKIVPRLILWFKYFDMIWRVKLLSKPFKSKNVVKCIEAQLDMETIPLSDMFHRISSTW